MIKVLVTVPNLHWIHTSVVRCLMLLQKDMRYSLVFQFPSHIPLENNIHHIIKTFITGDFDFWLSIDADNPPINNPLDLVELNKDIIGLPTPIYHCSNEKKGDRPVYLNAYKLVENGVYKEYMPQRGLQLVDATGAGCVLYARRVFMHEDLQKGAFSRILYDDGTVKFGADMAFCKRAKLAGFEIWVHFDYQCDHFNEISLTESFRAFSEMRLKNG